MQRLSVFVSRLVCGVMLLASVLYAMEVVSDLSLPKAIDSGPDCSVADCAAGQRHAARLVCRAA